MVSLFKFLENIDWENENPQALKAIRAGLNIDPNFWEDFLKICNQSQALAELLGVRKEIIARWPTTIRRLLNTVSAMDAGDNSQKATMISTGK